MHTTILFVSTASYPPTSDIGYALWLKYFALNLPALADRYQIAPQEVDAVLRIAAEFTDWLVYRTHRATQLIRLRQTPTAPAFLFGPEPPVPKDIFLLDRIADLVQRLRAHPAYCEEDGCVLGLLELSAQQITPNPPLVSAATCQK